MSQTIDNRIVEMQFENKQFESGVQESLSTLDKLKKSLNFDDASKNLQNFSNSVTKNLDMNGIGSAVEKLKDRFSASGIAGMRVIENLVDFAISAGKSIASALDAPFAQIRSGGWSRAMNIEDAKFQLKGLGITWESVFNDIDYAVSGTAYGLDAAAKACSQLSASGIQAGEDMKAALRGISGVAAMGNTEYENIAQIFTKAAGNGKVMADELNRISQYGLNARASLKDFFNAINEGDKSVENIPENVKKRVKAITDGVKVTESDISEFASKSKIDFATFSYAMDQAFGEHAKAANETFMGSLRNIKAALSKIGAEFATPLIKGAIPVFNEIRVFLNDLRKQMGPLFDTFQRLTEILSGKLTAKLKEFRLALLGESDSGVSQPMRNLEQAFYNIREAALRMAAAIIEAFKEVFPHSNNLKDSLISITEGIANFTKKLIMSDSTLNIFKNALVIILTILKNVGSVIKNIIPIVEKVMNLALRIASAIVGLIGYLGSLVMNLESVKNLMNQIRESGGLITFVIDKLKTAFSNLVAILTDTSTVTGRVFTTIIGYAENLAYILVGSVYMAFVKIKDVLSYFDFHDPLGSLIQGAKNLIAVLQQLPILSTIISGLETAFGVVKTLLTNLIELVKTFISNLQSGMTVAHSLGAALTSVFTGVIGVIGSLVEKIQSFFDIFKKDRVIQETIELPMANATASMVGMEHQLTRTKDGVVETTSAFEKGKNAITNFGQAILDKIKTIKTGQVLMFAFGTSITILAANLVKLTKSFTNLTNSASYAVSSIGTFFREFGQKKTSYSEAMISTAIAIGALTAALWTLSKVPRDDLLVTAGVLEVLLGTMGLFSVWGKNGVGPFASAMLSFSGGILLLVAALYALDQVNMENMAKKLGTLAVISGIVLTVSIILSKAAPKLSTGGIAILAFAGAVYVLAKALEIISHSDLDNIQKNWVGLGAIIVALAAFASIASNVGIAAALGLIGFVGVLNLLIKHTEDIKKNMGNLEKAFSLIVENLKNGVEYLYNGLKKAAEDMQHNEKFAQLIQGGTVSVIAALTAVILALGHAGKGLKKAATGFVLVAAAIAGLMFVTVKVAEFAQSVNPEMLVQATDLLNDIMIFIGVLTGLSVIAGFKNFNYKAMDTILKDIRKLMTSLTILVVSIGAFAAMVGSLSEDEFKRVNSTLKWTEITIGAIAVLCTIISSAAAKSEGTTTAFGTFAGIVLLLGSLVGTIAVLMFMFSQVDWKKDAEKLITVAIAFGSIVGSIIAILGMLALLEKNAAKKGSLKAVAVLGTFVAIIAAIGLVVYALNKQITNDDELKKAGKIAAGLLVFLVVLEALVIALEKFSLKLVNTDKRRAAFDKSLKGLIIMLVGLGEIITALFLLKDVSAGRVWGQVTAITFALAALVSLVLALEYFTKQTKVSITKTSQKNLEKTFLMLAALVIGFKSLAKTFESLKDVDAGRMWGQATALATLLTALSALGLGLEYFAKKMKLDWSTIGKITVTITAMVALFGALSLLFKYIIDNFSSDTSDLLARSQTIMLVLGELSGIVFLASKFLKSDILVNGLLAEVALAGMVALFMWLTKIFEAIDKLKTEGIMAKSQTIILVMAELIALIEAMGGLVEGGAVFVLGAVAELALWPMIELFGLLTKVFVTIDGLKTEGIVAKSQAIILVMTELIALIGVMGGLVYAAGEFALGGLAELALWPMINLFGLLTDVFVTIDGIKTEGILAKSQAIILVMTELVGLIALMGGLVYAAGEFALGGLAELALWPMINLFGLLTDVFVTIDGIKTEGILPKSQAIILVMTELIGLISLMGLLIPLLALGSLGELVLWPMIELFDLLAEVFLKIDAIKSENILEKAHAIILVLLELEGLSVLAILGTIALLGIPGLEGMVEVMSLLTDVFLKISLLNAMNVDMAKLQQSVDMLIDTLWSLIGVGTVGGAVGDLLEDFADGIKHIGESSQIAAEGVTSLALGMGTLTGTMSLLTATQPMVVAWFDTFEEGATKLSGTVLEQINKAAKDIVQAVTDLIEDVRAALEKGETKLYDQAAKLAVKIKEGFDSKLEPEKWGEELADKYAAGMRKGIPSVSDAADDLVHAIWEYIHFSDPDKGDLANGVLELYGAEIPEKYGNGIESNIDAAVLPVGDMTTKISETLSDPDKIKSVASSAKEMGMAFVNDLVSQLSSGYPEVASWISKYTGLFDHLKHDFSSGAGVLDAYTPQIRKNIRDIETQIKGCNETIAKANGNTESGARAIANAKKKLNELNPELKENQDLLSGIQKNSLGAAEASSKLTTELENVGKGGGKAAAGAKEAKDAIADFYDMVESSISLFDKFEEEEAMSSEELLSNMESQIVGVTNWANNLSALASKGIDQGLLQKLSDMGPSGQKYVAAFVNMTNDELVRANTLYQQSLLLPATVTAQVYTSFQSAGINATTGFIGGLDHDAVRTNGIAFAKTFITSFESTLGIASPSKVTNKDGKWTGQGFIDGVLYKLSDVMTAVKTFGTETITWFELYLDPKEFVEIGKSVVEGIQAGIEDAGTQSSLFDSIRSLCNKIVEEAKSTKGLDINSPSKKFQAIGKSVDEGLAKGIGDNVRMVTEEMGKTTTDMVDEMRQAIDKANEALIDEVDDPVIRPVLDLSNVMDGSRSINDIFSRNQALSASRSFRNLQNEQWGSQSALLSATMDNSDVVGAIDGLKTDINSLKDAMTNIRMVLDTGTMVGAMTPMIDQQLGMRQVYAGRGM